MNAIVNENCIGCGLCNGICPEVFVMGDDWEGKFDFLRDQCEVVYLPRTPEISTTKIKSELNKK